MNWHKQGSSRTPLERMKMLVRYAGYDETETPIVPRGPASRFSEDQIGTMVCMAGQGASSLEIGAALNVKAQAVRARLNRMGIRLRKRVGRLRIRLVVPVSKAMQAAADVRGITVPALIRRLLRVISKNEFYFDELLPIPQPHSLGAAAVVDRWHNQPPAILRRIELTGCTGQPQLAGVMMW
jgi:hypothetical protein